MDSKYSILTQYFLICTLHSILRKLKANKRNVLLCDLTHQGEVNLLKHAVSFFKLILFSKNFYWGIADLQCCVSFKCTAKQNIEQNSLCQAIGARLCMKCSLGISNFPEETSSLSHSVVFLYFFALISGEFIFNFVN